MAFVPMAGVMGAVSDFDHQNQPSPRISIQGFPWHGASEVTQSAMACDDDDDRCDGDEGADRRYTDSQMRVQRRVQRAFI
jgi:hypothetical protein